MMRWGGWVRRRCPVTFSLREIFPTEAGQLSDKLKFLAGQNIILQGRRLICYQITISFCQKSQDICQTNWTFLQDRMKICRFCQTVLQFSQRLNFCHRGVQLTSAFSWARPAVLAAGKGRGKMLLFLLFLHFLSFPFFFPIPIFHLLYYLFYLFSPFLWETTQNDPQGLTCR